MITSPIVDASVIAKLYAAEPHAELARVLMASGEPLVAPSHAFAEVVEVLVRKVRLGHARQAQPMAACEALNTDIQLRPLTDLLSRAADLSIELHVAVYDTLYLALAEREATVLVTSDRRLLRRVAASPYARLVTPLDPSWTPT